MCARTQHFVISKQIQKYPRENNMIYLNGKKAATSQKEVLSKFRISLV